MRKKDKVIRKATLEDIPSIKKIADANKNTLGFVMSPALAENIARGWGLVQVCAECEPHKVVAFVNYRHRKDSQTTIYEICIAEDHRQRGVGRILLDALVQEAKERGKSFIQLKAIATIPANDFYRHYGFQLVGTEIGRKQLLNVWRFGVGVAPTSPTALIVDNGLEVV